MYRHSILRRRVIDPKLEAVQVIRFRCGDCRKLVRVHPPGVVPQSANWRTAQAIELEHQLCLAHWRKALAGRLKKIPGYDEEKDLIREALKQLDEPALRTIRCLHGHFSKAPPPGRGEKQTPAYAMRMLTLDITEDWNRLICYQRKDKGLDDLARPIARDYTVPTTNNATENSIGRAIKVRSKLMRGFTRPRRVKICEQRHSHHIAGWMRRWSPLRIELPTGRAVATRSAAKPNSGQARLQADRCPPVNRTLTLARRAATQLSAACEGRALPFELLRATLPALSGSEGSLPKGRSYGARSTW
jgi:hypothetical protein